MQTTCHHCLTIFRINAEELTRSRGMAICGVCHSEFLATQFLENEKNKKFNLVNFANFNQLSKLRSIVDNKSIKKEFINPKEVLNDTEIKNHDKALEDNSLDKTQKIIAGLENEIINESLSNDKTKILRNFKINDGNSLSQTDSTSLAQELPTNLPELNTQVVENPTQATKNTTKEKENNDNTIVDKIPIKPKYYLLKFTFSSAIVILLIAILVAQVLALKDFYPKVFTKIPIINNLKNKKVIYKIAKINFENIILTAPTEFSDIRLLSFKIINPAEINQNISLISFSLLDKNNKVIANTIIDGKQLAVLMLPKQIIESNLWILIDENIIKEPIDNIKLDLL